MLLQFSVSRCFRHKQAAAAAAAAALKKHTPAVTLSTVRSASILATSASSPSPYVYQNNNMPPAASPFGGVHNSFLKKTTASSSNTKMRRTFAANTIYKFDVEQKHLDAVKATLPLVAKAGTDFTKHFYNRMFTNEPELMNIFNQTNQALGGQPKKLLKTVAIAAQAAIETGELPGEAIEGICQKHAALGVTPEAYDIVGANLLGTIEDLLTTDADILGAWGALYGNIAQVFITREAEIVNEVASIPGSWSGRRKFVLEEKETMSSVIRRFKFRPADGLPTPAFKPGKFTTIWVDVDNEEGPYGTYQEQPRHYTLALQRNPEDAGKFLSISVKREGLVSRILHKAEIGTEFDLSAPYGCFDTTGVEQLWLSEIDAPVVFISAGVGITPVLAMLENIYVTRPASWLHAAQNGATHAYRDRLREIAAVRAGDLQRRVWYEDPSPEDGSAGGGETNPLLFNLAKYQFEGRMNLKHDIVGNDDNILHLENPDTQYYMCGPEGFMNAQRETLMSLGVPETHIHWEGF